MGRHDSTDETQRAFETLCDELLADPDVQASVWFGLPAAKVEGKMFAALFENALIVKLGAESVTEVVDARGGERFDPSGKGMAMKDWLHSSSEPAEWAALLDEALDFVRTTA